MAYLVTGGTGFIGSYVVRDLLNAEKRVVCLQRSGITPAFKVVVGEDKADRVKIIRGDVANTVQLFDIIQENDIDLIIHLGYLLRPASELEPAYALQVNCIGMNNVLEAVRLLGLKRAIWVSSIAVSGQLGEIYKQSVADDDMIYKPVTFMAATKALNEFMSKLYFDRFGTDCIGFRLGRTFGIGKWTGGDVPFNEFLRKAALNIPATIGSGEGLLGYAYVEDISDLIVQACDAPPTRTRVFNAVEGEYTLRQVAEVVQRINPDAQVTVEGGTDYWPLSMDTTAVQTELGWQPTHNLEDGIRKVFNYFRQQEELPSLH